MRSSLVILVFCLPFFPMALLGKRVPPNPVSPVIYSGIEYSARGDGKIGCVAATEIATGKQLWAVPVFKIHPHWWKGEEDNQWIFISGLWLDQNGLTIKDERSRCYVLICLINGWSGTAVSFPQAPVSELIASTATRLASVYESDSTLIRYTARSAKTG